VARETGALKIYARKKLQEARVRNCQLGRKAEASKFEAGTNGLCLGEGELCKGERVFQNFPEGVPLGRDRMSN